MYYVSVSCMFVKSPLLFSNNNRADRFLLYVSIVRYLLFTMYLKKKQIKVSDSEIRLEVLFFYGMNRRMARW